MMSDDYRHYDSVPTWTITERLAMARAAAQETHDQLETIASECDQPDKLAMALELARETKRSIGDQERAIVRAIVASSDERQFDVPELGMVQIRYGMKRTGWDHPEVTREFVRAFAERYGLDEDVLTLVTKAIEDFRDTVSVSGAKKPFAAYTGRQLDEFCHEEPQAPSVQIVTPEASPRLDA